MDRSTIDLDPVRSICLDLNIGNLATNKPGDRRDKHRCCGDATERLTTENWVVSDYDIDSVRPTLRPTYMVLCIGTPTDRRGIQCRMVGEVLTLTYGEEDIVMGRLLPNDLWALDMTPRVQVVPKGGTAGGSKRSLAERISGTRTIAAICNRTRLRDTTRARYL